MASILVPGVRSRTLGALLLAAATYALLSVPASFVPAPSVPYAGIVVGLLVSMAILWILGEIVPDFDVAGLGSAFAGAMVVLSTGWVFAFLAIRIFPYARGLLLRILTAAVEIAGGG